MAQQLVVRYGPYRKASYQSAEVHNGFWKLFISFKKVYAYKQYMRGPKLLKFLIPDSCKIKLIPLSGL